MTSAEINISLVFPLRKRSFPQQTHKYDPKKHNLIEDVTKSMITRHEASVKFNDYDPISGTQDEVCTDWSNIGGSVWAAAAIKRHLQNDESTCRHLSKRIPGNSTIFVGYPTAVALSVD